MTSAITGLLDHKYEAERMFAGCAFIQPDDCIRDCGWLKPEQFSLVTLGNFWRNLLAGMEPSKAAIDAKCYTDLLSIQGGIITTIQYASFAETIQEDEYLISMIDHSEKLVGAAMERDKETVSGIIGKMSTGIVSQSLKTYDAVDVALQTRESYAVTTPDGRFLELKDPYGLFSPRFADKEAAYAQISEIHAVLRAQYLIEEDKLPQYVVVRQTQTISDWETVDTDDLPVVTLIVDINDSTD